VKAIERWHAAQHGTLDALDLRHQIGWLLWLEDVAPVREKDCWSQRIRKDIRQMPPASRKAWRAILENTSLAKSRKPRKPCEKQAKTALAGVPPRRSAASSVNGSSLSARRNRSTSPSAAGMCFAT
jgi:hypothetical protein